MQQNMESFSDSSGEHNTLHLDMLLLEERERRFAAEQLNRAAEQASLVQQAALAEVCKENAALQRACGYGKVPPVATYMRSTMVMAPKCDASYETQSSSKHAETCCQDEGHVRADKEIGRRKSAAAHETVQQHRASRSS